MGSVLEQLGLDRTFFMQLAVFVVLFGMLSKIYFKPFLKLFKVRHEKTVGDRQAAEKLLAEAKAKLEEYKKKIAEEKLAARREAEAILDEAKKEESRIMGHAREEAKKITHEAAEMAAKEREGIRKKLEAEVDALARVISERFVSRG